MRKAIYLFCCIILSTLFFAEKLQAQKKKNGNKAVVSARKKHPVIVLDGVIYTGELKDINPNDIQQVSILKPPGSVAIYGTLGADGAVLITTKAAQPKIDSAEYVLLHDPALQNEPIVVLDGHMSEKKFREIDTSKVFSVDSITRAKAAQFNGRARNGIIVVITKAGATERYQSLLSGFSPAYKNYLAKKADDSDLLYFLFGNGSVFRGGDLRLMKALTHLKKTDIKTVNFNDRSETATGWKPASVSIELNK